MSQGAGRGGSVVLTVGALGVVFGDIGTSPLYALRTILGESGPLTRDTVLGVTSTLLWSMVVVVTVLYVGLLLRVDNEGEGGLLALVALVRRTSRRGRGAGLVTVLGMVGAAMFLGDCVITPAISVLSAAEGLEVANPAFKVAVLPIAVVLLAGVFILQRIGTGVIGKFYGPIMVVWFVLLAVTGAVSLAHDPGVLVALSPHLAVGFFVSDPLTAFLSLGAVILTVTGAEALYADLGHFGRRAISSGWLLVVLPALVLAYLGEASAVIRDHGAASQPFYSVVPGWATIPVLVIATAATVIASEAVIAGAFTVLHQLAGLGLFPHLRTEHTSRRHAGQIYLPAANWALAVGVLAVVAVFGSSASLSSAYGVAVSSTILVTATVYIVLDRARHPGTSLRRVVAAVCWVVVLVFFAASVPKLLTGGWAPACIGLALFVVMSTWSGGQGRLAAARESSESTPEEILQELVGSGCVERRVEGTAVFLTPDPRVAPLSLRTVVETGYAMVEHVVLLSWQVEDKPSASPDATVVEVDTFGDRYEGILSVAVTLGYRERLNIDHVLEVACEQEPEAMRGVDHRDARFFVSDPIPRLSRGSGMAVWRQRVFLVLDRLTTDRIEQLSLPAERTVVIGREFGL
ncbi:MAG: hypothetical protein JWR42_795 [Marmoricola sp.]|nr:hypothetical protein [Marmoricola sp.]